MRDASGFPARYNLIRLYRKAVHDSDAHENVGGSEIMLAMDYFDALEVDEFCSESEKFSKFMGLSIYEDLTEHDVAMQSIPLYCPEITAGKLRDYFRLGYLPTLTGRRRDLSISPNLIS